MGQLCLYLDDEEMEEVRARASERGTTLSRYVASVLKESRERSVWPPSFFALYGALREDDGLLAPADEPFDGKPIPALD